MPEVSWASIAVMVTIVVGYGALMLLAVKIMIESLKKYIDRRDVTREKEVEAIYVHIDNKFDELTGQLTKNNREFIELEKNFLKFKAQLPVDYVRREDWIRFGAVIDAKQDGLRELVMRVLEQRGANEHGS
ncbi:MAG: hypothetical protein SV201_04950 [Pseudomonadota bacterium]|nr:hypothetical protein [Pseudomonadota bacterium]